MQVTEALNWRYAVKKFSYKSVSQEKVQAIVEAINLSASSTGMQPYRVVVVSDKALQRQLGEGSFNTQITDASHLIVFAAFDNVTRERIGDYMNYTAAVRNLPVESLTDFRTKLEQSFLNRTEQENFTWAAKQAYIGLGTGLIAAAESQVDATPMEGFDPVKFDSLLNLREKGLKSVVVLALGYRDAEKDMFSQFKKVRLPLEEFALETV